MDDRDRVPVGCECPTCGEADIDSLCWVDDNGIDQDGQLAAACYEHVECVSCGSCYHPGPLA